MSYDLNVSGTVLSKILDSAMHPPWHDVSDGLHTSISPQSITGGSETTYTNNGAVRNATNLPDHITSLWDTSTNVTLFSEELDTPVYTAKISFAYDPATAGTVEVRAYINDSSPKLIQTNIHSYKNAVGRISSTFNFYLGSEVGYDAKNDGVYFTITPSGNMDIYDKGLLINRT